MHAQKVCAMFHKGQKGRAGHGVRMALHVARSRAHIALHDRAESVWHCMSRGRAAEHAVRPTCHKVERGVTNVSGSACAVAPRTKIVVGRRSATTGDTVPSAGYCPSPPRAGYCPSPPCDPGPWSWSNPNPWADRVSSIQYSVMLPTAPGRPRRSIQ
jgi:hypothetical protein